MISGGGGKLVGHGGTGGSGVSCYNKRDGIRKPVDFYKELNHPIFKSIRVVHNPPLEGR